MDAITKMLEQRRQCEGGCGKEIAAWRLVGGHLEVQLTCSRKCERRMTRRDRYDCDE